MREFQLAGGKLKRSGTQGGGKNRKSQTRWKPHFFFETSSIYVQQRQSGIDSFSALLFIGAVFSGIVTNCLPCLRVISEKAAFRVVFEQPAGFRNLFEGDSVAVDGVCLTVEDISKGCMTFALGPETLKITGWNQDIFHSEKKFNLEKSLTLNQAIGGHFVTGHADGRAGVSEYRKEGESVFLTIELAKGFEGFFWKKGYITLNGVSLTINETEGGRLKLCLVPKTLQKTNLSDLKVGDFANFEVDYFARFFVHGFQQLKKDLKT